MYVIGLMSGTSTDGIDAALVNIEGDQDIKMELVEFISNPYSDQLKQRLKRILPPNPGKIDDLTYMHYHLGQKFGEVALCLIEKAGIDSSAVKLIASHGYTVRNLPPREPYFSSRCRLQIGEIAVIAELTGITTVGDFRPGDVAAGGEGAPLIPYFDYHMFQSDSQHRVALNIGGIANISYLPAGGNINNVKAFDVGPGNMIIDEVVNRITDGKRHYDHNGALAAEGNLHRDFLQELMKHHFIRKSPPKSAGHEDFGSDYVDKILSLAVRYNISDEDLVATVTEFTAEAISLNCTQFLGPVDEVIVSGGGAYNNTLLELIRFKMPETKISTTREYGIPITAKEAMGFALLGYQTIRRVPNNVPSATGAKHLAILGKIAWGRTQSNKSGH